ncbi:glycosyltransferase family 2 protein [Flavobacterium sp. IB48]|uniref:glycosyltransferase family 2 protein n=1 Tax=Flavobacterium sp. IB48 TaxID=2779375 RepID=UPI0018E8939D|nr:glycosyltransferase family 2 protein [Flavobacterium sp. IB48]MBJ2126427.1 glycosyltransferase family 2 protein [Flavobacterium sp. IB48]
MNSPKVSVIIPTYNRAHIISETLDSILNQIYQNWECIIVDDGSNDETENIINKYLKHDNRFKFYRRPADRLKGANACRNYGIENSCGAYIMFLDSDDICESFCLEERVKIVTSDLSIDLLIRDGAFLLDDVKLSFSFNKDPELKESTNYLRMFLSYTIPWQTTAGLYKKSCIRNCKFDENLKRFQDVSFNVKVLSQTNQLKLYRDFKIDTYYRVDESKVLNNNFISNVLESLVIFYDIHSDLLTKQNYLADFRKFSCKIILEFAIPHFDKNKKEVNLLFKWFLRSDLYSFKQKTCLLNLMLLLNTRLFSIKGVGMNKFRVHLKKVINK